MDSILPDLAPRDSHSLWYTSSRAPLIPSYVDFATNAQLIPGPSSIPTTQNTAGITANRNNNNNNNPSLPNPNNSNQNNTNHNASSTQSNIERSFLGRLRVEEIYIERRRLNIANLGATWLKPPGHPKTLFQIREERREQEEHAEAVRREQLAAELAAAAEEEQGGQDDEEEDIMDEGDEEGGEGIRDLDEEIPDADDAEGGFGFDGASDEEEEEEQSEEEEEEEEESEEEMEERQQQHEESSERSHDVSSSSEEDVGDISLTEAIRERRELANRMASIRATEERMRGMIAARQAQQHISQVGHGVGLEEEEEEIDEEISQLHGNSNMLEEEDLLGSYEGNRTQLVEDGEDMDMDADLDDDIPPGGAADLSLGFGNDYDESGLGGGYEHTDSEVSLSSDEGGNHNTSYASALRSANRQRRRRSSGLPSMHQPQHGQYRRRSGGSTMRGNNPRSSLDISGFLSVDESSNIGSSPQIGRRTSRYG
ncbi:Apc15p protein-domain-containing protein [Cladorrhinum sp. PSN259]|nr:Apc15p protein-domain-containing protein [Cladorrhinum sp. PSN259]